MLAHAQGVTGADELPPIDLKPFIELQEWLEDEGARKVVMPFAKVLVDFIPKREVRMRRDFRQLLTCIQAIALLFQCQRDRSSDGAVIAMLDDNRIARELLAPLFNAMAVEGLTPAIRQTVETIRPHESNVSEVELARATEAVTGGMVYSVLSRPSSDSGGMAHQRRVEERVLGKVETGCTPPGRHHGPAGRGGGRL